MAILLNALAPSLSHALGSYERDLGWDQICSASGSHAASFTTLDSTSDNSSDQASAVPHCPFCAPQAGHVALPAPSVSLALPNLTAVFLPPLFYQAHRPLFAWSAANPRGPPAA